jgi:hypothetical protein
MLAVLGMGVRLMADGGSAPAAEELATIQVGQVFWVEVLVDDQRAGAPAGIISLPVDLSWDPAKLEFLGTQTPGPTSVAAADLLITPDFVLQRAYDAFAATGGHFDFTDPPAAPIDIPDPPNFENLRGGALPNAGQGSAIATTTAGGTFSQLRFRALAAVDNSPFTVDVTGSVSFADADALQGVDQLSASVPRINRVTDPAAQNAPPVVDDELLAVTEFIKIVEAPRLASLSGYVYVDTNPANSVLDRDGNGVAVEFGIPNVTIQLFRDDGQLVATTTTGADGGYLFDSLDADVYRVVETQPPLFFSSGTQVGTVLPANQQRGVAGVDQISEIRLALDDDGVDYNFGEIPVPDKRMFLARTDMRLILAGQRGVAARTVSGTTGADTIVVEAQNDALVVTVNNGAPQSFPLQTARILYVDGKAGQDTVEFVGTAAAEVAHLSPGTGTQRRGEDYSAQNYAVMAVAAEQVIAEAASGDDLAIFRDSPANDALVAAGNAATLATIDNRLAQAIAYDRVRALALVHSATEQNTAEVDATDYLLDLEGNWTLI